MYEPRPIPTLEEIDQEDRRRDKAIYGVEIFDHSVKCQKCAMLFLSLVNYQGRLTDHDQKKKEIKSRPFSVKSFQWEDGEEE